jgi:hypothetical protein
LAETGPIQEAFRRGVRGEPWQSQGAGRGLAEAASSFAHGPNEAVLMQLERLPGLADPRAAFETGRALRMILRLFDQANAPAATGQQFVANLGAAIMAHHMRRMGRAWGAADTVDMFVDMYERILGARRSELVQVRRTIMDFAVDPGQAAPALGWGLANLFGRRRALKPAE